MKILQINTTVNSGSTGKIAEEIGNLLLKNGHQSVIAYGRRANESYSQTIKVGNYIDIFLHGIKSYIFDLHGLGSTNATKNFLKKVDKLNPDIIHLHNIHGYYLNYKILFKYFEKNNKPIVWTFHDCWPYTGHCSYYTYVNCAKWKKSCYSCQNIKIYPKSIFVDNSANNFEMKRNVFCKLNKLYIVAPSRWLSREIGKSFLKEYHIEVINNGIDLKIFKPFSIDTKMKIKIKYGIENKKIVLGVANVWNRRKGLDDFLRLYNCLDSTVSIVLVGLSSSQIQSLPKGITGLQRTENSIELAKLYSAADVYVNPTMVDNFPTTNLESLACGTPVVTYDSGGSHESVDKNTGKIAMRGDFLELKNNIERCLLESKIDNISYSCRKRAEDYFDSKKNFMQYLKLYEKILFNKNI